MKHVAFFLGTVGVLCIGLLQGMKWDVPITVAIFPFFIIGSILIAEAD